MTAFASFLLILIARPIIHSATKIASQSRSPDRLAFDGCSKLSLVVISIQIYSTSWVSKIITIRDLDLIAHSRD